MLYCDDEKNLAERNRDMFMPSTQDVCPTDRAHKQPKRKFKRQTVGNTRRARCYMNAWPGGRKFSKNQLNKRNRGHGKRFEEVAHHTSSMAGV